MRRMSSVGQTPESVDNYSLPKIDLHPAAGVPTTFFRRCLGIYLSQLIRVWSHLPVSLRLTSVGESYARHLHRIVGLDADRKQYFATFFLRNRAELELIQRLVRLKPVQASLTIAVLACSKGAEVYSILWAIRSARPDLKLHMHAVDISEEILAFGERGIYSLGELNAASNPDQKSVSDIQDVTWNTDRDQGAPIFERMTVEEMKAFCDIEDNHAKIKAWLREGITWLRADASDPGLARVLGLQDIVVANRFLCHMEPTAAEDCLRNIARLVKPGGYIFVSGIDLDVRAKVARALNWTPVVELIREVHDGDSSLRIDWPLGYWTLEPFREDKRDWKIRYASVFQIGTVDR
jgi:chemotaxis methyl-accepting protein methylase